MWMAWQWRRLPHGQRVDLPMAGCRPRCLSRSMSSANARALSSVSATSLRGMVTNLVALPGAPNGIAAVSWPSTSFHWCHSSMRPTGARALTFAGIAARAAILPALPTSSTASRPANMRAPGGPHRTAALRPRPGNTHSWPPQQHPGRARAPARPSPRQDPQFQPSQRPGRRSSGPGLRRRVWPRCAAVSRDARVSAARPSAPGSFQLIGPATRGSLSPRPDARARATL
jgi:hypothetical protein